MNKQLLIFDLDGTVLDTLEDIADSLNFALSKNGFPTQSLLDVKCFVGNGIKKLVERAVPKGTNEIVINTIYDDFCMRYKDFCAIKTRPYDGIIEVLKSLKAHGYLLAIVSNKADFAVQKLCNNYFNGIFSVILGEREDVRRKPYPDLVEIVLSTLFISKENALFIGDSDVDIVTAKNAGLDIISVTWGFRNKEFLLQNGGKCFANTPTELLMLLSVNQK